MTTTASAYTLKPPEGGALYLVHTDGTRHEHRQLVLHEGDRIVTSFMEDAKGSMVPVFDVHRKVTAEVDEPITWLQLQFGCEVLPNETTFAVMLGESYTMIHDFYVDLEARVVMLYPKKPTAHIAEVAPAEMMTLERLLELTSIMPPTTWLVTPNGPVTGIHVESNASEPFVLLYGPRAGAAADVRNEHPGTVSYWKADPPVEVSAATNPSQSTPNLQCDKCGARPDEFGVIVHTFNCPKRVDRMRKHR